MDIPLILEPNQNTEIENPPFVFPDKYKLAIKHSKVGGVGVFATDDIQEQELIEKCVVVPLENRSKYHTDGAIWSYCFTKPLCECNECKRHGFMFLMVLGHGMIYNHQDDHSADMLFDYKNMIVDIVANRKINKGDEIFVSYGNKYFTARPKITLEKKHENSDHTNVL